MGSWLPERLPEDIEAERALLATLCAAGAEQVAARECRILTPEHFVHPGHRAIFKAMAVLVAERQEINSLTIKGELEHQGELGKVGGFPGVVELLSAEEVGRPQVLTERLSELLRRRKIICLGAQLVRNAADGVEGDSATLITGAMADLGQVARDGRVDEVSPWLEILEMAGNGEPFRDGTGERGGWWGIPELDEQAPIPGGMVTFIGARPGVGKTALGTQVACESALQGRRPTMVQFELPKKATQARIASYFGRISTRNLKEGRYDAELAARLREVAGALTGGGILCPRVNTPWNQVEASLVERIERGLTDLVVLDYFGLIGRPPVAKGGNEAYAYAKVSEAITAFAKDYQHVGVVLLGQLKADAADREPKDGDAADSDRPARDAAVSLMLWRDAKEQTWSVLRKNRDGALGWKKPLTFEGWAQRFSLAERQTDDMTGGW